MTLPRIFPVSLICILIYFCSTCVSGEKCSVGVVTKIASFEPKTIYSPGYPNNYEENEECTWTITAAISDFNYAIQIISHDMDINDYGGDCNSDYIEVYAGQSSNLGGLMEKWCGSDKKLLKQLDGAVTLKFKSDGYFNGKGFVLEYSLVKYSPANCVEGQTQMIEIGNFPLYESFNGRKSVSRCEWKIQASDPDNKLVLEMFKPSSISCNEAKFEFYDGGNTNGHVSFEYCSNLKPFSIMYLSSHVTSLVLNTELDANMDNMVLKISTRSTAYDCTTSSFPTLDVTGAPVIFSMPFAKDNRDTPCPVRIWSSEEEKMLRLDVMGTDESEATCDTDIIEVTDHGQNPVMKSCNRGRNPVYRGIESSTFTVKTKTQSNVFLRASAVYWKCNGNTIRETAYESLILEEALPKEDGYSDLSRCNYLITANKDGALVRLSVHWQLPIEENHYPRTNTVTCLGDYMTIFDGDSEMNQVLASSCYNNSSPPSTFEETVVSTRNQLLVVMDADARIEGDAATLKFHSIPGGEHCMEKDKKTISVNRTPKTLMSPNYPDSFPMYQACVYHLTSENPEDDIVVKVLDSNLDRHCRNVLTVYDGEYGTATGTPYTKDNYRVINSPKTVGRVCGTDTPTYRIASKAVSLFALSEEVGGPGGWKVEVYTVQPSSNSAADTKFSLWLASLVLALGLLFMTH